MQKSRLATALFDCAALLRGIGETWWTGQIEEVLTRSEAPDASDASQILRWFGGMGSLNDFMISRINGHHVTSAEEDELNRRLNDLRGVIFDEATRLHRSTRGA